jgi:hypothetical protein
MNCEIQVIIGFAIFVGAIVLAVIMKDYRHAFLVPEGYAGLLYHKGKFMETLGAGRHLRWGRHFTLGVADLRKTSLLVAVLRRNARACQHGHALCRAQEFDQLIGNRHGFYLPQLWSAENAY